jgi:hypothetical protein
LVADAPPDIKSLTTLGARGIEAWCRAYPLEVMGLTQKFDFDYESGAFHLYITVPCVDQRSNIEDEVERDGTGVRAGNVVGELREGQSRSGSRDAVSSGCWSGGLSKDEGLAIIFVPYIHYLHESCKDINSPPIDVTTIMSGSKHTKQRLIGSPSVDHEEWVQGCGPAVVDLEVSVSHGRVEAEGQWLRWVYPLGEGGGERDIKFRKWGR